MSRQDAFRLVGERVHFSVSLLPRLLPIDAHRYVDRRVSVAADGAVRTAVDCLAPTQAFR
jgi:hypothetical protein